MYIVFEENPEHVILRYTYMAITQKETYKCCVKKRNSRSIME